MRAARTSASRIEAGMAAPCNEPSTSTSPSGPRRGTPTPCQAGRKRARATPSTGSTSLRSTASDRRRSRRRTSSSHHSRSTPSGRNSPRTMAPSPPRAARARPARGAERARNDAPPPLEGLQRQPRLLGALAEALGHVGGQERAVGAGVAGDQVDQGPVDGLGEGRGQAGGQGDAQGVPNPGGVLGGGVALVAGHRPPHPAVVGGGGLE